MERRLQQMKPKRSFCKNVQTIASRIIAIKAGKRIEKPQCNDVKEINGVDVHENIVYTHNVFSIETVNNVSGQHKYAEILLNIYYSCEDAGRQWE